MSKLFRKYQTDKELEVNGVPVEIEDWTFVISRAGGRNQKYAKIFSEKSKPYQGEIASNTLDPDTDQRIMVETFVEACLQGWHETKNPQNTILTSPYDGKEYRFPDDAVQLLIDVPDLYRALYTISNSREYYSREQLEQKAKN
jgi:hypothetical protein